MKNNIYKARIVMDEKGIHITSFANRQIPYGLFEMLNKAVHHVADIANGTAPWKKYYIHFEYDGKRFRQYDCPKDKQPCNYCCFNGKDKNGSPACYHPYGFRLGDGTKGNCEGKAYKEDTHEEDNVR